MPTAIHRATASSLAGSPLMLGSIPLTRLTLAAGLALVTILGALTIPSAAWFAPTLAIAALVLTPASRTFPDKPTESFRWLGGGQSQLRQYQAWSTALTSGLLYAALGASIGVVFLLAVMAL